MNTADGLRTRYTVLVGVDYSSLSALVLSEAVNAARARDRSHIHVVHVAPPPPEVGPGAHAMRIESDEAFGAKAAAELRAYLQGIVDQDRAAFESDSKSAEQWTLHVRFADADDAIAQLASDIEADLVVVGTHGHRGLERLLLGSVAEGVVRLAPCPVLVVRPVGTIAAANSPRIEPPCPRCLETRRASGDQEFWCEQHREHQGRRHTYLGPFSLAHRR